MFELRARTQEERDEWVEALEFLVDIRDKLNIGTDVMRLASVDSYFSRDSGVSDKSASSPEKPKTSKNYKYRNVGKDEILGIMDEGKTQLEMDPQLGAQKKQSDNILLLTGILDDVSQIPENQRDSRMMYGFLGKPNRSALKIEKKRWVFLISSRPLNQQAYLVDQTEISEDDAPITVNFDTIYYYSTGFNNEEISLAGQISALDIDTVTLDNDNNYEFHSFTIEAKSK